MNTESYWQQFTNSGRIEDYLTYRQQRRQADMTENEGNRQEGENPYAGTDYGNGHDLKSDAYR